MSWLVINIWGRLWTLWAQTSRSCLPSRPTIPPGTKTAQWRINQDRTRTNPKEATTKRRLHCKAVWTFPQKCAPSGGRIRPITRSLRKDTKVKVNAQGYSHLPTHLMVSVDRYDNYLSKKVSLGTQIFIFCQIWQFKKQYYEKVNKFWLVSYEIEQAPTYEKSHSVMESFS